MSDHPFDDSARFDCIVGGTAHDAPPAPNQGGLIHVTVRGEGLTDASAIAQDLTYLIEGFRGDAPALDHEIVQRLADVRLRGEPTVEIVLHDLGLEPDAEGELRELIHRFVELCTDRESRL